MVEEVKWKKPSNPAGVPVWSRDGIVCIGEALKNAVRLTFPKGARWRIQRSSSMRDWTARLLGIDVREGEPSTAAAFAALIREAVS